MKKSLLGYIKEWQKAIKIEIMHLKQYGSTKYLVRNGNLFSREKGFTYFFEATQSIRIPAGSKIKLEWGTLKKEGKVLTSEGKSVILSFEESLGNSLTDAYIHYDPWELLDNLFERIEDLKDNKKRRLRVKRLLNPSEKVNHPMDIIKSNVHELILRSKYNPVTFVWGPPGTGKTYTLARVAANKYFKKKKVLILSHSNQAVDVLIKEIASFISKKERFVEGDVLRYGTQSLAMLSQPFALSTSQLIESDHPELAKQKNKLMEERGLLNRDLYKSFSKKDSAQLLEIENKLGRIMEKIRQKEMDFLEDAFIIGTTLAKAAGDKTIYEKDYDVVIVDEASMAYVPQAAFAASLGRHVIICGDFKQLPPIASARHELVDKWLREDIFHLAGVADTVGNGMLHPQLLLLKEQRRMHPDISSFTNMHIYHSLVGDHPEIKKQREALAKSLPFAGQASVLLHTSFTGEYGIIDRVSRSRVNLWHLLLSFQNIHEGNLAGIRSIGYISPYRAQANLMESFLEEVYLEEMANAEILSATVHRFQGSEKDLVIFDSVDSYPVNRPGMLLMGKESERLLNVAITRTRGKFVHICDTHFMKSRIGSQKTIRKLILHQESRQYQVFPKDIGIWVKNQHAKVQWMHALKLEKVLYDMAQSKKSVIIGVPSISTLSSQWLEVIKKFNARSTLVIVTGQNLDQPLFTVKRVVEELTFPFVMIDEEILWLGTPYETGRNSRPPYVSVRAESSVLCRYLLNQFNLTDVT
ncbi:KaiC/GvpD/RAD55 family RecA-like ATPase [Bacillus tianshenii]|uniref:KaiC/GvpD/RAD55 family RecA-like ATPase n=1 Tax=Sutcliffiella tianshenii TaxID=1463404 RepID=A0ABS2NX43_9BACI|nr:AAA domain-containing protein [Bacillus tianshenii]MBM7619242.1 KaiC/GvpD/RAD55 family RecA-like ATPase [Bacillus tianshenii]